MRVPPHSPLTEQTDTPGRQTVSFRRCVGKLVPAELLSHSSVGENIDSDGGNRNDSVSHLMSSVNVIIRLWLWVVYLCPA